jgi:phosphate transport system substrate-binding protein
VSRLALLPAAALAACATLSPSGSHELRLAGSETMRPLAARWARAFEERNPGVRVHVEGGGTESGVQALVEGRVDLATASRPLLPEEVRRLAARHGTVGLSIRCARDGLAVYLNPGNPVRDLGLPSLKGIFSGRMGTWHKVGGPEAPIHVFVGPPGSGAQQLFRDLVLREEPFSERAVVLPTSEAIVAAVASDPHGVGFGSLALGRELVHVSIDGHEASRENVARGVYPLARYLFLHAVRPPRGLGGRFVDFVLSAEGQRLVDEAGFVSMWGAT